MFVYVCAFKLSVCVNLLNKKKEKKKEKKLRKNAIDLKRLKPKYAQLISQCGVCSEIFGLTVQKRYKKNAFSYSKVDLSFGFLV